MIPTNKESASDREILLVGPYRVLGTGVIDAVAANPAWRVTTAARRPAPAYRTVEAGASFLSSRKDFQILVIDNDTQVPFITSDQPIINMLTEAADWNTPERIELYYPLSPTQAMLYLEKSTPVAAINQNVSIDEAHRYNMMMLDHSAFRVFSNSDEYLRLLKLCVDRKG
jgi:hypothetical protein